MLSIKEKSGDEKIGAYNKHNFYSADACRRDFGDLLGSERRICGDSHGVRARERPVLSQQVTTFSNYFNGDTVT